MQQVHAEYLIYLEERVDRRVYRISLPSLVEICPIENLGNEIKKDKQREA